MKKTVKGFTLIELIIVMAIFGVIMVAATQMVQPVSEAIRTADAHENGNAVVSSISNYIRNQVSPAEFITVYTEAPVTVNASTGKIEVDTATVDNWVQNYVQQHYAGVVKGNSNPDSPTFANGKIHVLFIDNDNNGYISEYTYNNVVFGSASAPYATVAPATYAVPSVSQGSNEATLVINKAYYDSYDIELKFGNYDTIYAFDTATSTFDGVSDSLNSRSTVMTIKATRHQTASQIARGDKPVSFLSHSAMSLINIYNKSGSYMKDCYYVPSLVKKIDAEGNFVYEQKRDAHGTPVYDAHGDPVMEHVMVNGFVDLQENSSSYGVSKQVITEDAAHNPLRGNGYCIIYSYNSEINTTP